MLKNHTFIKFIALSFSIFIFSANASDIEVSLFAGKMFGSSLSNDINNEELTFDSGNNIGFSVAWQDSPNGQGQVSVNQVSHEFSIDESNEQSLDITYAHFNGVAQFRQKAYVTTVSLGLGGAYFDYNDNNELYPSATLAFGTRYEFSKNIALITEIRGFASLVDDDDGLFCTNDLCTANFDDSLWLESNISVGLAIKF